MASADQMACCGHRCLCIAYQYATKAGAWRLEAIHDHHRAPGIYGLLEHLVAQPGADQDQPIHTMCLQSAQHGPFSLRVLVRVAQKHAIVEAVGDL
jgi:hypothetical protein